MLTSVIGVVVLLGGLIFFHELGHFSVARFFKVQVETFSLGFGKKLFSKKFGATEYCLSLIPLGGYVKLFGDDPFKPIPSEHAHHAFYTQKLYKRFLIVAAGPLANLILAFFLYTVIFWNGKPMDGTTLGSVQRDSVSWQAGLRPKDKVLEVNGRAVTTWNDLHSQLKFLTGQKIDLKIQRKQEIIVIPYTVAPVLGRNDYGEDETVGGLKGVSPFPIAPVVGISNPESWGAKVGFKTGDFLEKIGSVEVQNYEDIQEALQALTNPSEPFPVKIKRPKNIAKEEYEDLTLNVSLNKEDLIRSNTPFPTLDSLGMHRSDLFVRKITPGSPAEKEGLSAGDRIVKVGDQEIAHFENIVEELQKEGPKDSPVLFTLERDGKTVLTNIKPIFSTQEDPLTRQKVKKYMVGFMPYTAVRDSETVALQYRSPVALIRNAAFETYDVTRKMAVGLVKLVTGKVSVKNLGGPVLIARFAGKSLDAGIIPFLQMMAMISLNLFLLNLFPVPVLDGGHLLFFSIEAIKGKPVSLRTMEIANQVGMALILMLVALTLFNDITRLIP